MYFSFISWNIFLQLYSKFISWLILLKLMADMGEESYRKYFVFFSWIIFFFSLFLIYFLNYFSSTLFQIYFLTYSSEIDGRHGWGRLSDPATCFNSLHSMHGPHNAMQQKTIRKKYNFDYKFNFVDIFWCKCEFQRIHSIVVQSALSQVELCTLDFGLKVLQSIECLAQ